MSPQYYSHLEGKIRHFRKNNSAYPRSEDGLSPSQSSDYEDTDEFSNCSQQVATVHVVSDQIGDNYIDINYLCVCEKLLKKKFYIVSCGKLFNRIQILISL